MGDVQSALVECPQRIEPMTTYSKREKLKPLIRIVDDNQAILNSLTFMLTCEGYEVASFSSAEAFLAGDTSSREGLLILDVQMPGLSGLELFKVLNMRAYKLPIIFLTAHADVDMAVAAMREGACDFHQKPINPETLLPAIARGLEKARISKSGLGDIKEEVERFKALTEREEQICRLVAKGLVSREIAERLVISQRTVDHHRTAALSKLNIREPAELALFFERIDAWRKSAGHAGQNLF